MIHSRRIFFKLLLANIIIFILYNINQTYAVPGTTIKPRSYTVDDKIPQPILQAVKPFIPANYTLLYLVVGDLNRDQYPDILLALKHHQEAARTEKEINRPLLLLVAPNTQRWRVLLREKLLSKV